MVIFDPKTGQVTGAQEPPKAQIDSVQRRAAVLRAQRLRDQGDPFADVRKGFGEGVAEIASKSSIPFVGVGFDAKRAYDYVQTAKRLEAGTGSDADVEALARYLEDESRGYSVLGRAGSILGNMPTFGAEFALSGGAASLGRKGAAEAGKAVVGKVAREAIESATRQVAEKAVTSTALRRGLQVGDAVLQSAAQAALTGRYIPEAIRKTAPQLGISSDDADNLKLTFQATTQSFLDALPEAYLDQVIETVSEKSGPALAMLPGVNRIAAMQAAVFQRFTRGDAKVAARAMKALETTGWNGMIQEMGEERLGDALRAAVNLQDWSSVLPSPEQLASEAIAFATPGAAVAGASKAFGAPAEKVDAASTQGGVSQQEAVSSEQKAASVDAVEAANALDPQEIEAVRGIQSAMVARGMDAKSVAGSKLVEPSTPLQRAAAEIVQSKGGRLVLIDAGPETKFNGVNSGGVMALNANLDTEHVVAGVLAHELLHRVESESPGAASDLASSMRSLAPELWRESEARASKANPEADEAALVEETRSYFAESLGGYLAEAYKNPERLRALLRGDSSLVASIIDTLIELSNRVIGTKFKTKAQQRLEAFRDEVARTDQEKRLPPRVALQLSQLISESIAALNVETEKQKPLFKAPQGEANLEGGKQLERLWNTAIEARAAEQSGNTPEPVLTVLNITPAQRRRLEKKQRKSGDGPKFSQPSEERTQAVETLAAKALKRPDRVARRYATLSQDRGVRAIQAAIDQTNPLLRTIPREAQMAEAEALIEENGGIEGYEQTFKALLEQQDMSVDHAAIIAAALTDQELIQQALDLKANGGDAAAVQAAIKRAVDFRDAFGAARSEHGRALGALNTPTMRRAPREALHALLVELPEDLKVRMERLRREEEKAGITTPEARRALTRWRNDTDKTEAEVALLRAAGAQNSARIRALEAKRQAVLAEHGRRIVRAINALNHVGIDPSAISQFQLADPVLGSLIVRTISAAKSARANKAREYVVAGIVSSPTTQVVNVVSNTVSVGYRQHLRRLAAALVSTFAGSKPGDPGFEELGAFYDAWFSAFGLAGANAAKSWQTENSQYESALAKLGVPVKGFDNKLDLGRVAIEGKTGRVVRVPFRLLQTADDFAKTMAGTAELAALAHRRAKSEGLSGDAFRQRIAEVMQDPAAPEQMEAWRRSKELAFQAGSESRVMQLMLAARDHLDHVIPVGLKNGYLPLGTLVVPFVTTTYNVLGQGVSFPLHPIAVIARAASGRYKGQRAEALEDVGSALVSLAITGAVVSLVAAGDPDDPLLTGSAPTNPAERALIERTSGAQTIRLVDRSVSYDRLEPLATTVATTVDAVNAYRKVMRDEGSTADAIAASFGRLFSSVYSQVQNDSFLYTVGNILKAAQEEDSFLSDKAQKIARNTFIDPLVPNVVRATMRAVNNTAEDTKARDPLSPEAIVTGLTGAEPAPNKVDVWGRDITPYGENTAERLFSPAKTVRLEEDVLPVDRLILNYNARVASGDFGEAAKEWAPGTIPRYATVRGVRVDFTPEEYQRLQRDAGAFALAEIARRRLDIEKPDLRDIEAVQDALNNGRARARANLLREKGVR